MLRASIKYGIGRALSARPGIEIWDFDLKEETAKDGEISLEIRYRYHSECVFRAQIKERDDDGTFTHDLSADHVPGQVMRREEHTPATIDALYTRIERWTGFLADELVAYHANRVLAAQQKALAHLGRHLRDLPDRPLPRQRAEEYVERLDGLERAVIELRPEDDANAIKAEFDGLRQCAAALGERSFLQAVLVRLIQHFWDEDNLRIVEAGNRAAIDFLGGPRASAKPKSRIDKALQEQA